jgi:uncharacterized membrane protein
MSIASMADSAIQRKRLPTGTTTATVAARGAGGAGTGRTITPLKGASDLARYIPTEAIAIYISILAGAFAALTPKQGQQVSDLDYSSRWLFFFAMLGVTAGLVWLIYAAKTRQSDRRKRDVPVFEIAVAMIAMGAWAAALPDTPFADFKWYGAWFPPLVLATTTALLPLIAAALGKTAPTYEEVEND